MEKLLLTAEEAGEVLSIGRTAIYELMARGLLESVSIGRSRRIPARALSEFVERLRSSTCPMNHPPDRIRET